MENVDLQSIEAMTKSLEQRFMRMFPDIDCEPSSSVTRSTRRTRASAKAGKDEVVGTAEKDALREWWRDLQSVITSIKHFTEKRVAASHASEMASTQEHDGEDVLPESAMVGVSDRPREVQSPMITQMPPCDSSSSLSRGPGARGPESIENGIRYRWEATGQKDLKILILMPTAEQLRDLKDKTQNSKPALFACADALGAPQQGAFVIEVSEHDLPPLPAQSVCERNCTAYSPEHLRHGIYRMKTYEAKACFGFEPIATMPVKEAEARMKELLESGKMSDVFYETDIPARTAEDRTAAGLPRESLIAGIRGNQLDATAYSIDGMHTPTGYRGTPFAPFVWHDENFWAAALNILYSGRKMWYWVPPAAWAAANDGFRMLPLLHLPDNHQYLQDEGLFGGLDYLKEKGIDVMSFEQRQGQIMFQYSRVLHSGFSMSGTLAEAVNYADERWKPKSQGYEPRSRRHPDGRKPISWVHMRQREPGALQLREGEVTDGESPVDAQPHSLTEQSSPGTSQMKRKIDPLKSDRGQKRSRIESATIAGLRKLAVDMQRSDKLCNIPSFDEKRPPTISVLKLAIAIQSRFAIRQLCSLIRNQRKRSIRPRFNMSEDVSARIKQRLTAIAESQNDKFKVRLHQWFLAKEIDDSKKGSIRADKDVIRTIRDELGLTKARYEQIIKKGRKWKEICDEGLLCFIPLTVLHDLNVSPTEYRELKSEDIAMLRQLLDNDYARSISKVGKHFLEILMGEDDVEFRWESEHIAVDDLSEEEMLYYLQPVSTTPENIYDPVKYSHWPRPAIWPEKWSWPADPTRISPGQKQCDFCTRKRACKCLHEIFPTLTPLIKRYDDKGLGLEASASQPGHVAYKKDEVIGQLAGEIAPHDTYNDHWTVDLVRPDLEDAPVCQIHCAQVGNIFRLVNHSCEPLAHFTEKRASGRWIMAIVAKQDIYDGSEITVSYGKPPKGCLCQKCGVQDARAQTSHRPVVARAE